MSFLLADMQSASSEEGSARSTRLQKYFYLVLNGKRNVKNAADAKLFLEAVCDHKDRTGCIEKIVASSSAMSSLRLGLRSDVSIGFVNSIAGAFLNHLSDPVLKQLCNGMLLEQILHAVVAPPTFWNALFEFARSRMLNETSTRAFAWLLLELLSSPTTDYGIDMQDAAEKVTREHLLLSSASHEIRTLGHKIQHVLLIRYSSTSNLDEFCPGGRHDNDFADFRKIAILPTADELMSSERPFYRRADAIREINTDQRPAVHLDNQFRLLREDLVGELRNDLQVATGQKKGRRPVVSLNRLSLHGIDFGTQKKRKRCALSLYCLSASHHLRGLNRTQRKTFVSENKNFIKHQSFGCLLDGREIVAFATIDRNDDFLVLDPPVVFLQISGEAAFQKALASVKRSHTLQFLCVDTPVFAYEPILKCLQDKMELPLADELLQLNGTQTVSQSPSCPYEIVGGIEASGGHGLKKLLQTDREINLDKSQTKSLLAGLQQSLSLVQGPPGMLRTPSVHSIILYDLYFDRYRKVVRWRADYKNFS